MTLNALLKQSLDFSPLYGAQDKLFTHLPMALFALSRMGASEQRLEAFMSEGAAKLQLKLPCEPLIESEWLAHLGQARYYTGYEGFFAAWIARDGVKPVLMQALPHLMPAAGSAAFHSLIRLAYALETNFEPEIAAALASWAVTYERLHEIDKPHEALPSQDLLHELLNKTQLRADTSGDFIIDRMQAASRVEGFARLVPAARYVQPSLKDLAACSLAIYRHSYNFTALHMVTATHAARVLLQYLPELQAALMQHLVPAWLAAWVSIGCTPVALRLAYEADEADVLIDWQAKLDCASTSSNEHVIKICYSAWREYQHYGFAGYASVGSHVTRELAC